MNQFIHETAIIEDDATIGEHTQKSGTGHTSVLVQELALSVQSDKMFLLAITLKLAETSKFKIM